ncbi:MAG TPA: hypothetical protein VK099_06315 [Alcanivoracaceae bacterium]|nr:hypothetical protein [Alcanivoracaceae bacterium]
MQKLALQKQKEDIAINENVNSPHPRRKPWVFIGVTVSLLILMGLIWTAIPKGFKRTHEQIGTGKPALVFVYDPNLEVSAGQADYMNEARDQLNNQVFFLVAQPNTPEGDQFIAKHRAIPTELLLFDASGKLIKRQFALQNADELIQWITADTP